MNDRLPLQTLQSDISKKQGGILLEYYQENQ